MDEVVNIIDLNGNITKKTTTKLKAHQEGICHGISTVAIINDLGQVLLQKRAKTKRDDPGKWDLSAAGHIALNESITKAVIRETYEEINIKIQEEDLELIDKFLFEEKNNQKYVKHYTYLFVLKKNIDIEKITMSKREVEAVKFIGKDEFIRYLKQEKMVKPMDKCLKLIDYLK